jgi:hypothetical protein
MSRSSRRCVTFAHPFRIVGMTLVHPPGTFDVYLEEDEIDLPWPAFVGVTTIMLGSPSHREAWVVKPDDLEAALAADAARTRAEAAIE